MRLCGIVLLVLACAGAGYAAANRLREEQRSLDLLCGWTEEAAACIRHQQTELAELLRYLSVHPNYRRFRFMTDILDKLSPMTAPRSLWENAVASDSAVPASAKPILVDLGQMLGTTDCEGQLAALRLHKTQLAQAATDAREIYQTKGKLCRALGLLGGAMAAVVLL